MSKERGPVQHFQRIPILDPEPLVECGAFPAIAIAGEDIPVAATVFREGHDLIGVAARLRDPQGRIVDRVPLFHTKEDVDRYRGSLRAVAEGLHSIVIEAWADDFATWRHRAEIKLAAGVDVELMLAEGVDLLSRHLELVAGQERIPEIVPSLREILQRSIAALEGNDGAPLDRLHAAVTSGLLEVFRRHPSRSLLSTSRVLKVQVHRERAGRGAWYEFFPRSEGAVYDEESGTWISGTFATAQLALERAARMGFDVVYLPPIHPIGEINRKGRNNTLNPRPGDPGSPWAIGSKDGGHDAIHPDLGTVADFDAFVARARELGLEIALDLALQAAPDHPWVETHPEFFTTQLDGSIAYAENPPKKYQDIYPLNFDNDYEGLREEVLRIVTLWISHGVTIFRVDNPHTKPVRFWEWLIATVHRTHPEVVFLAEAFTRPAMMHALAKAGFQQSYSYFTWRNTKEEIEEYLTELAHESGPFLRPNFFVNTPDILTEYLQFGGPAAFRIRAALAATASPLWGVYAGFELFEHVARPGAEEYVDNEKYEYKARDFAAALEDGRSLAPYLTTLNAIRRAHPALGELRNITLHESEDEGILVFSKRKAEDTLIVVINVDPHATRETMVTLDLRALLPYEPVVEPPPELGAVTADGRPFTARELGLTPVPVPETIEVEDLLTGQVWEWGERNYVRLDPKEEPAHILHVRWPEPERQEAEGALLPRSPHPQGDGGADAAERLSSG